MLVCVKPLEIGRKYKPSATTQELLEEYSPFNTKKHWASVLVTYITLPPQGGKTQWCVLMMYIAWELLGAVNYYIIKNSGGRTAAPQVVRDISTFNTRLNLLLKEGISHGVHGLKAEDAVLSAQRFSSNATDLAAVIDSQQCGILIDLFNSPKLSRLNMAQDIVLQHSTAAGGAHSNIVPAQLFVDEVDATITAPTKDLLVCEILCHSVVRSKVALFAGCSATPAVALLTETHDADVITLPQHERLVYVGWSQVSCASVEDPSWAADPVPGNVTMRSMETYMARYIRPMLVDQMRDTARQRCGILVPSPSTVREVHECLAQRLMEEAVQIDPRKGLAVLLLNCGHRDAPDPFMRNWRMLRVSKSLIPHVPALLNASVCRKIVPQEDIERHIRDTGSMPMTIREHLKVYGLRSALKKHGDTLAFIMQHIAVHASFKEEIGFDCALLHDYEDPEDEVDGRSVIYLSTRLDAMASITLLKDWIAYIKVHTVFEYIGGNVLDRTLTLKDFWHEMVPTDLFWTSNVERADRARAIQASHRVAGLVERDAAGLPKVVPRFWGAAEHHRFIMDCCRTEDATIAAAKDRAASITALRLHEQTLPYDGNGRLGKWQLMASGAISLSVGGQAHTAGSHVRGQGAVLMLTVPVRFDYRLPSLELRPFPHCPDYSNLQELLTSMANGGSVVVLTKAMVVQPGHVLFADAAVKQLLSKLQQGEDIDGGKPGGRQLQIAVRRAIKAKLFPHSRFGNSTGLNCGVSQGLLRADRLCPLRLEDNYRRRRFFFYPSVDEDDDAAAADAGSAAADATAGSTGGGSGSGGGACAEPAAAGPSRAGSRGNGGSTAGGSKRGGGRRSSSRRRILASSTACGSASYIQHRYKKETLLMLPLGFYAWHHFDRRGQLKMSMGYSQGVWRDEQPGVSSGDEDAGAGCSPAGGSRAGTEAAGGVAAVAGIGAAGASAAGAGARAPGASAGAGGSSTGAAGEEATPASAADCPPPGFATLRFSGQYLQRLQLASGMQLPQQQGPAAGAAGQDAPASDADDDDAVESDLEGPAAVPHAKKRACARTAGGRMLRPRVCAASSDSSGSTCSSGSSDSSNSSDSLGSSSITSSSGSTCSSDSSGSTCSSGSSDGSHSSGSSGEEQGEVPEDDGGGSGDDDGIGDDEGLMVLEDDDELGEGGSEPEVDVDIESKDGLSSEEDEEMDECDEVDEGRDDWWD